MTCVLKTILAAFWLVTLGNAAVLAVGNVLGNPVNLPNVNPNLNVIPDPTIGIPGLTVIPITPPTIVPLPSGVVGSVNIQSSQTAITATHITNPGISVNPSGLVAAVMVTTVVSAFVTICPTPTVVVHGVETYTIEQETTLTITRCPCTISFPLSVPPVTTGIATAITAAASTISNLTATKNQPTPLEVSSATQLSVPVGTTSTPLITLGSTTNVVGSVPTDVPTKTAPVTANPTTDEEVATATAPTETAPVATNPTTDEVPSTTETPILASSPSTGNADRVSIGLGVAFLSGIIAMLL